MVYKNEWQLLEPSSTYMTMSGNLGININTVPAAGTQPQVADRPCPRGLKNCLSLYVPSPLSPDLLDLIYIPNLVLSEREIRTGWSEWKASGPSPPVVETLSFLKGT